MKKFSKRSKLILGFLAVILVFLGYRGYCTFIREQNVFDQMYYSRVHKSTELDWFIDYRRLFRDMPQLHTPQSTEDDVNIWTGNMVFENYKNSCMEDNHGIIFTFFVDKPLMGIEYWIDTEDSQQCYSYVYRVDQKTLTYETSNPENTEMKNFLFDRVLPDWFAANQGRTRFSIENLGEYTLIDTTVEVQHENYSIEEKQISFDNMSISDPEYRIALHKMQSPTSSPNETALVTKIIQRKSDQTYYLFLEKTAEIESCLSVSVFTLSGDQLQIIEEQSNVFSPYYLEHMITFDDFNCDGYSDMAVIVYEGTMNVIYQLYVWNPDKEQFVKVACDEPLNAPEVRDGMVVNVGKLGAAELEITHFKWENEYTLVKSSSEIVHLEDTPS